MKDYYDILEVSSDASQEKIKEQYRFLVNAWHPDKFRGLAQKEKAEEKIKQINEAYNILSDIIKRSQYDREFSSSSRVEEEARKQKKESAEENRQQSRQDRSHSKNERQQVNVERLTKEQRLTREKKRIVVITLVVGILIVFIAIGSIYNASTQNTQNTQNNTISLGVSQEPSIIAGSTESEVATFEPVVGNGITSKPDGSPFEPIAGDTPMEGCTVATILPQADPTAVSLFPAVSDQDWARGPSGAAVTIVEYSDFQCATCGQLALVLALLQQDFPNDLRLVYRHFPQLNTSDKSALAMQAAEASGQQEKFWEMHDVLFQRQVEWSTLGEQDFQNWLTDRTAEIGVNANQYAAAMFSAEIVALPRTAFAEAVEIGLPGVPFLLINGRIYDGPIDYVNLSTVIRLYALQSRQYTQCPPMIIDPALQYFATLQTVKGNIVIELLADKAPLAVNNFIFLATQGWYDNVTFHRVLQGFMAQAGDPTGTGFGGPGYAFKNEESGLQFNGEGLLAMANAGPDSNGSQFFITVAAAPHLNGGYTIFGEVIEGMDVVKNLTLRDPSQGGDLPPGDLIITITIEQK